MAGEPKHGYAILKDVADLSAGRVQLSTGTLYGALRRLLEDGWIERYRDREERDRQAYRLTVEGRRVLAAEVARLRTLVEAASARLGLRGAR